MLEKKKVVLISYLIIALGALAGFIYMIFNHKEPNEVDKMILIVTEEYNNETKDTKYSVSMDTSYQINLLSDEKVFMKIMDFNNEGIRISFDKELALVNSDKTINYDNLLKDYSIYIDSYLLVSIKNNDKDVIYQIKYTKDS